MNAPTVIIKHRRYASAVERLGYLLGEKEKRGKSRPAIGPRVGRYWGSGFPLGGTVETDAAFLMLNALTVGRCECIEFLVSEEQIGRDGRTVETVVECLMKEFFPGRRWVAVRHSDRPHAHVHLLVANDDGRGLSLQIDGPTFQKLRRRIAEWSRVAESGWGKGKKRERELAALSDAAILDEVRTGRLVVVEESAGRLRTLQWDPNWQSCAAMIRWWKMIGLLTSRAAWLELNIINSARVFRQQVEVARARALARLEASAACLPAAGPAFHPPASRSAEAPPHNR